jgi:protein-disulfide isomerase
VDQLHAALGDELRYVFRNFPKSIMHPNSEGAAEAAEASSGQNKFWEMHNILYDHQIALSDKQLRFYATQVGLDMERFNREMMQHTYALRVAEDISSARQSGVGVAPGLFVNGRRHLGPYSLNCLLTHIEIVLSKQPAWSCPAAIEWLVEPTRLIQSSSR